MDLYQDDVVSHGSGLSRQVSLYLKMEACFALKVYALKTWSLTALRFLSKKQV